MNKDNSWSLLQSTFDSCRSSAKKTPRSRTSTQRKTTTPKTQVILQPIPRRRHPNSATTAANDARAPLTPSKRRCVQFNQSSPHKLPSPRNKENLVASNSSTLLISDSSDSIDFDPDHDGFLPDGGFCRTPAAPKPAGLAIQTGRNASAKCRIDFTNILTDPNASPLPHLEVPETQSPAQSLPFQIDDDDTQDVLDSGSSHLRPDHQPTTFSTANHTPSTSNKSTADASLLLVDSSSSSATNTAYPLSAPHRCSPERRGRPKPRPGGLVEQLDAAVHRCKSNAAFWLHERRSGLVEAGTLVEVLEMRQPVGAIGGDHQLGGGGGGGCLVRVRELIGGDGLPVAEMILQLDGDLKLCARLQVGARLEVDLRMATRLRVRLGGWRNGRTGEPGELMTVYPNVQFVRESREMVASGGEGDGCR